MTIKPLRLILLFGAASITLLSACSTVATTSAEIERLPITYYSCENEVLEARFSDSRLYLSGFSFSDELYATVAASGARYESSSQRSFWSKGDEALLQTGPVLTQRCLKVASQSAAMVFGDWKVVSVGDTTAPAQASVSFGDEGNVFGSDGCNRFMGGYQVSEGFSIGPLASTRMACMDAQLNQFATMYLAALQESMTIERPDADTLVLISASGTRIVAKRQ